ncbi:MAG: copper resistance protein CopC [Firmicutes bacterium]|nr:copper resistance protein CopC [Bacillota bacterium]
MARRVFQAVRWLLLGVTVLAIWTHPALGHASLVSAEPSRGATVTSALEEVVLTFSEPVEARVSIVKVYPLAAAPAADLAAEAAALVNRVLTKRGDEDARADAGVQAADGPNRTVRIRLKDGLEPGPYVVMWRVLSVDTHVVQGHYVFVLDPAASD